MDDRWTRGERDALRELGTEAVTPAGLEDRVVRALRSEGLLSTAAPRRSRRRPGWRRAGLAAAALVFFLAGIASQRFWTPPSADGQRYVLLLRDDRAEPLSPEAEADRVQEYSAWARKLTGAGKLEAGEKLSDGKEWVRDTAAHPSTPADHISGFFVLRTTTKAEALKLAQTCPHVDHGGSIEVRRIEPTSSSDGAHSRSR